MEEWKNVAIRRFDNSTMEEWKDGRMEEWKNSIIRQFDDEKNGMMEL
jgi:hypothetical protein